MKSEGRKPVRWHEAALQDLTEIVEHIAESRPDAAQKLASDIFAKVRLLEETPRLGPVCPYYRKARQLIFGNYVIYYTVHRNELVVRAVIHSARLFRLAWLKRENQ
jgi:plasmid stabilization system protein ParE